MLVPCETSDCASTWISEKSWILIYLKSGVLISLFFFLSGVLSRRARDP